MNLKKLSVLVAVIVLLLVGYKFFIESNNQSSTKTFPSPTLKPRAPTINFPYIVVKSSPLKQTFASVVNQYIKNLNEKTHPLDIYFTAADDFSWIIKDKLALLALIPHNLDNTNLDTSGGFVFLFNDSKKWQAIKPDSPNQYPNLCSQIDSKYYQDYFISRLCQ